MDVPLVLKNNRMCNAMRNISALVTVPNGTYFMKLFWRQFSWKESSLFVQLWKQMEVCAFTLWKHTCFLLHHDWLVADVMHYEEGMTFNEIVRASFELLEEYPSCYPSNVQEPYIAWCLIKLMEFGMVEIA